MRRRTRRRRWTSSVGVLVVMGLVAAATIAVAQPQVVVGPPLPRVVTQLVLEKPDPPKLALVGPPAKAGVVDLVDAPAPVTVAPPGDPLAQQLAVVLREVLVRAGDAGQTGISVVDADGRVVADSGGTVPMIPASTAKLVTAAAALTAFGPDHTFTTTLSATGVPGPDGVLHGDLILTGGGDPTLVSQAWIDTEVDPERPFTPISLLADEVVEAGITRVTGTVLGVDGFLQGEPLADGWPPRYLEDLDATPISGLTVDEGLELYTTDAGTIRARASTDPPADAARALAAALQARGVVVDGVPNAVLGQAPTEQTPLAALRSPPLSVLLTTMVQESDNHIADTVFRAVGVRVEGVGTFDDGAVQAQAVLAELELDWSMSRLADGSGLSRESRIPPELLTVLNYRMTRSSVGPLWQDLMAVSGVSGTLQRRLVDTIAELRLRGKTGSLGDVRALTGAVVGPDGRPLYFTVMSNGLEGAQLASARRVQDLLILGLSATLYGCEEIVPPTPPPPGPDGLPPLPAHTC